MKIGVISDTHLSKPITVLGKVIGKYFGDADLIFHAGDLISEDVLDAFDGHKIIAVAGNSDLMEVTTRLQQKEVISVRGFKIGLIHGWGWPLGMERRIRSQFEGVDCIVFGHSHRAVNHRRGGILFFNPGSFSGGIASLWRSSIGILYVGNNIQGEIIRI